MLRRLISSHLKTLTTISSTPRSPSPTAVAVAVAVSLFSRHFSTQTDAIKNKVDDAMPITTGNEREELQPELEGREILEIDHPVGPFGPKAMARVSVMNDALKSMYNAEERGERQVVIKPASKVIIEFLSVMQKHGYIGEFEYADDHRKIVVELNGRLNKCGVISPRFNVGVKEIEGLTARLLPSTEFGYIVLTTTAGIMDHEEARRKNVGGKVIGFFY